LRVRSKTIIVNVTILDECVSQLASESRKIDWVFYWNVWPDAISRIIKQLETMRGGIVGLIGRPATSRNGQAYERLGAGG